jgi:hypothetical protein
MRVQPFNIVIENDIRATIIEQISHHHHHHHHHRNWENWKSFSFPIDNLFLISVSVCRCHLVVAWHMKSSDTQLCVGEFEFFISICDINGILKAIYVDTYHHVCSPEEKSNHLIRNTCFSFIYNLHPKTIRNLNIFFCEHLLHRDITWEASFTFFCLPSDMICV